MNITKFGHACVRIEKGEGTLVVDPAAFFGDAPLEGASSVLITHEHFDHFGPDILRTVAEVNKDLKIWTNESVASQLDGIDAEVNVVGDGDKFTTNGFYITVHGELHGTIHKDVPEMRNIGFMLDGKLFHPGDAFTVPAQQVETLLVPIYGPWATAGDVIDFVREVGASNSYSVHDAMNSDAGKGFLNSILQDQGPGVGGCQHHRLDDGETAKA